MRQPNNLSPRTFTDIELDREIELLKLRLLLERIATGKKPFSVENAPWRTPHEEKTITTQVGY